MAVAVVAGLLGACGTDDASPPGPTAAVTTDTAPATVAVGPAERPTTLFVPAGYDPASPAPLLLLLHGYTSSGAEQDAYLGVRAEAAARGYLYLQPDGTVDRLGNPFWNATDACCNFGGSAVDDSGHLAGLIAEVRHGWAVDPGRVWIVGHSNGGFMAHRMACDHADVVVGIVSIAGATFDDPASCAPSAPVSVVQVHGTDDPVIAYVGGQLLGGSAYPSATATVATWAALDGCGDGPLAAPGAPLDLDVAVPGDETTVAPAPGCPAGVGVELWTVDGGGHAPAFAPAFLPAVFDFLEAHARV